MTNTPNVKTKQQTFAEMLKPLDVREFKRKNTTFFIGDVVGEDSFDVFEILRTNMDKLRGINLSKLAAGQNDQANFQAMVDLLSGFRREDIKELRRIFFSVVEFKVDGNTNSPQGIVNGGEMWRKGLSPMIDYELILRVWAVNFLDSTLEWFQDTGLLSRLQAQPQKQ